MAETNDGAHKLSKLQQAELEIFREFLRICEQNRLRYYIWGGSMLGAVRHKGFIPWDDDIDVSMPRPDFEEFCRIAPALLPEHLYLSTYKRGAEHITLVAQIFNKNKEFTLNNSTKQVATGAWIDILVIDGAPKPGLKRKLFGIQYMYHRMVNQFAHFEEIVNMNKERPWYEHAAIRFAQITRIEKFLNPVKAGDRFHRFLKRLPYEQCEEVAPFMGAAKMGEIIPKAWIGENAKYEFEGLTVNGPAQYDVYLRKFYGDYMTPPDIKDRNKHNVQEG